jgi:hypothetical protein
VSGARATTINFIEPVSGIAFFNPPNTISIVDDPTLQAHFYDLAGNFVKTSGTRKVTVSSRSRIARFKPSRGETNGDFETELIPAGWGSAEIEVATPGYPPFTQTVVITYLAVLWMCMAGGLLGALADLLTNRNRLRSWRILSSFIVGLLAALLSSWAYVVFTLPYAPAGILHSRVAVLWVSLLGGWTGAFILRKMTAVLGMRVEHMRS